MQMDLERNLYLHLIVFLRNCSMTQQTLALEPHELLEIQVSFVLLIPQEWYRAATLAVI